MWSVNETMTARRQTRLKFLEQESEQLRTYKSDLEFSLLNTKRLLSEVLSAQVFVSHRRIDSSADTEIASHVPLKTLESALDKNYTLLQTLKRLKKERDLVLGKSLISEQMAEETIRKEHEVIQESEDQLNDLKYVLDKKDTRIVNLKGKIQAMEIEVSKLKNESIVILPLSEDNLNLFKQTEKIKTALSKVSKKLQITELQTEELAEHSNQLTGQLEQYRILLKNPMIKNKKTNLASTQALDMTMNLELEDSDSSSSEICFPSKLQIETKVKPSLPKLDFSKVLKPSAKDKLLKDAGMNEIKTKSDFLEKKCMEKTEVLNDLRKQIKEQIKKNSKLAEMLDGAKNSVSISDKKPEIRKRKKKAMSNTLEYLTHSNNEAVKVQASEESEEKSVRILEDSGSHFSSFNGSEVSILEYQEPDSILAEYIHEIHQS